MSDFKVGDKCWYIYIDELEIEIDANGIAAPRVLNIDSFEIEPIHDLDFINQDDALFKSRQECIDAFKKRLEEL